MECESISAIGASMSFIFQTARVLTSNNININILARHMTPQTVGGSTDVKNSESSIPDTSTRLKARTSICVRYSFSDTTVYSVFPRHKSLTFETHEYKIDHQVLNL